MSVKLDLKNALINGDFSYFQRNTSFAAIASGTYTADRWVYFKIGTMVHTVSRSTDVPSSAFGIYSGLIDCTTAQASLGTTDYTSFAQRIEGNMLRPLKGKKIVFSFWVKATKTGTYCIAFKNATSTRSLIKEYSVSAANVWEKKIIRFEHDPFGSWNYDNSTGMEVIFTLASGSTYQTSANTWQSGNFIATSNQVNACDNIANNFQLADVCLQEDNQGQTRTPDFQLAGRDIFEELQLCQRYCEIGRFDPGSTASWGGVSPLDYGMLAHIQFRTPKRSTPVITQTNVITSNGNTTHAPNAITIYGFSSGRVFAGSGTGYCSFKFDWLSDAEL